jgi:hypothetical protein
MIQKGSLRSLDEMFVPSADTCVKIVVVLKLPVVPLDVIGHHYLIGLADIHIMGTKTSDVVLHNLYDQSSAECQKKSLLGDTRLT